MRAHPRAGLGSTRITTATTTPVKASAGSVHRVLIEVALTGTATFNEIENGADKVVTILPIGFPAGSHELNIAFRGQIEVITSAADRLVVVWE